MHNVVHRIITRGHPVFCRPRRMDASRQEIAKQEFNQMLEAGVIRPSKSSFASALHMVPKANNQWRPCGDYRALNRTTVPDRYPIPYLQDYTLALHRKRFFSHIDLIKAFYQIPVHPQDIHKTAITTPFGLYEMMRMPFGLRNSAQSMQRLMDTILRGLPYCFTFIDDILIASVSHEEHQNHLEEVFKRLSANGIKINPEKCVFGANELTFLGHQVTENGITPQKSKVAAVQNFPKPETQHELRRFLGMVNFYHRFLRNGTDVMQPLYQLLTNQKKSQIHLSIGPVKQKKPLRTPNNFFAVLHCCTTRILPLHWHFSRTPVPLELEQYCSSSAKTHVNHLHIGRTN